MSDQELFSQGGSGLVGQPWPADKASCLNAHFGEKMGLENQHINQGAPLFVPVFPINTQIATRCERLGEGTGLGVGGADAPAFTLQAAHCHAVCAPVCGTLAASGAGTARPAGQGNELDFCIPTLMRMRSGCEGGGKGALCSENKSLTLATDNDQTLFVRHAVRRLTPKECERLQGFPDGWTDFPWKGKEHTPDGPRYKALGNSMCVNVMRWIGERIQSVEDA